MIIIIIFIILLFSFIALLIVKAIFMMLYATYIRWFAKEKHIDRAYENRILKKSENYKEFINQDIFKDGI